MLVRCTAAATALGPVRAHPALARTPAPRSMLPPAPGFMDVANVTGGIHAYSLGVDPNVPTY